MTQLLLMMLTVFILTARVAQAGGNAGAVDVVVCTPKSVVHVRDDGSLVVEKPGELYKDNILIDLHTGIST